MPARKPLTFKDEINKRLDFVIYALQNLQQNCEGMSLKSILDEVEEVQSDMDTLHSKLQSKVDALKDAEVFAEA